MRYANFIRQRLKESFYGSESMFWVSPEGQVESGFSDHGWFAVEFILDEDAGEWQDAEYRKENPESEEDSELYAEFAAQHGIGENETPRDHAIIKACSMGWVRAEIERIGILDLEGLYLKSVWKAAQLLYREGITQIEISGIDGGDFSGFTLSEPALSRFLKTGRIAQPPVPRAESVSEAIQPFQYLGNCTNEHMAPYLQDMMDAAKEISYAAMVRAVGTRALANVFPDYDWGADRRTGLQMKNDGYVSYYRSRFNNWPCYYVKHSGIEYVFVPQNYDKDDPPGDFRPVPRNRVMITPEGEIVPQSRMGAAILTLTPKGSALELISHRALTRPAAEAAIRYIRQNGFTTIIDSDEEQPVEDVIAWLSTAL